MIPKEREAMHRTPYPVAFAQEIRGRLTESFIERPEVFPTDIATIEELIAQSRKTVSEHWRLSVSELLRAHAQQWAEVLPQGHARSILDNPEELEQKLAIRQFSDLDALRGTHPDYWYALVRASAERQKAETDLLASWVGAMPDSQFVPFGMSRLEILTALEIATKIGPFINETYMHQMEILDNPTLREQFVPPGEGRSKYLYHRKLPDGTLQPIAYMDMFPDTWPQIVSQLHALSYKTTMLVANEQLPPRYAALAALLEQTANTYGLRETNQEQVRWQWESLLTSSYESIAANCPVDFSLQFNSFLGPFDGNVDAEVRVGIETPATRALFADLVVYRDIARRMAQHYDAVLEKPSAPVRVRVEQLLYGAGSNLFWRTQGEASDSSIVVYLDSAADVVHQTVEPVYAKIFTNTPITDFYDVYVKTLVWHELGHTILSTDDAAVVARVGETPSASILEELKADLLGYMIAWEHMQQTGNTSDAQVLLEMLVTYCVDYIVNRDSQDSYGTSTYAGGGVVMLDLLLANGILVKTADAYAIVDPEKGFLHLKELADRICQLYSAADTTPEIVEQIAAKFALARESKQLQELLGFV